MKKHIVIGGAGFIGSHLCESLLASGNAVSVIDDFSGRAVETVGRGIMVYNADIDDAALLQRIFKREKPDVVHHLAGAINLRRSIDDPLFKKSMNVLGRTSGILEACRLNGARKIIFASSGGAVYENAHTVPTPEDYESHPVSLYGIANLLAEKYIEAYHRKFNIEYVLLRLGNVYGPRQWATGIIPTLITNLANRQSPVIYGDGRQTRDFVYVSDVVEAMKAAAHENIIGIFNVGSGKETSLNEVYDMLKDLLGSYVAPTYQPPVRQEAMRSAVDIAKIKQAIHWAPAVDLREGLKNTAASFQNP